MKLYSCVLLLKILFFHEVLSFQKGGFVWEGVYPKPENVSLTDYQRWFPQVLDHSNPSGFRKWNQRYFVNTQFYKPGGPAFLLLSGEGEASVYTMVDGAWINYAKRFGALCFQLEHRFYGKSEPIDSSNTENLRFLTSQQALGDAAAFIVAMNQEYNLQGTKWIVFGGSYAGNLAAWMRSKHPELVHGAVSSSSPLLAVLEYTDYYRIAGEAIRSYNPESYSAVKEAFSVLGDAITSRNNLEYINQKLRLCSPIQNSVNNENDIAALYNLLVQTFSSQNYGKHKQRMPETVPFHEVCDIMANRQFGNSFDRLAAVVDAKLKESHQRCLKYSGYGNNKANPPAWEAWYYQTCNEFGYYQTLTGPPQIFGNKLPLRFYIQMCRRFGKDLQSVSNAVSRTNANYGGKNLRVTNVVFVHGSFDPWYAAGITRTVNPEAPAIFIEGTAHCDDMGPDLPSDLPQLKAARRQISDYIGGWLQQ